MAPLAPAAQVSNLTDPVSGLPEQIRRPKGTFIVIRKSFAWIFIFCQPPTHYLQFTPTSLRPKVGADCGSRALGGCDAKYESNYKWNSAIQFPFGDGDVSRVCPEVNRFQTSAIR